MSERIFSVAEINAFLKENIEGSGIFSNISVRGEISNLTFNKSGHIYFSLKDDNSSIRCMIWKSNAAKFQSMNPKDGMEVTAVGRITYYIAGGSIGYEIKDVQLEGVGELQQLYNERYALYESKGYFANELKKNIVKIPDNIGIVTTITGAGVHDMITTIKRRFPLVNLFVFPTIVQGVDAPKSIATKIKQANSFKVSLDTLIVGRGGGSYEDLACFNEIEVIEAIYESNIPVISAVGHEPDVTIADAVADLRAATPTAAAEIATPDREKFNMHFRAVSDSMSNALQNKLTLAKQELENIKSDLSRSLKYKISERKNKLFSWKDELRNSLNFKFNEVKNTFNNLKSSLDILNPVKPLEKGFVILKKENKIIKDINNIKNNDQLEIITHTGDGQFVITEMEIK